MEREREQEREEGERNQEEKEEEQGKKRKPPQGEMDQEHMAKRNSKYLRYIAGGGVASKGLFPSNYQGQIK